MHQQMPGMSFRCDTLGAPGEQAMPLSAGIQLKLAAEKSASWENRELPGILPGSNR